MKNSVDTQKLFDKLRATIVKDKLEKRKEEKN